MVSTCTLHRAVAPDLWVVAIVADDQTHHQALRALRHKRLLPRVPAFDGVPPARALRLPRLNQVLMRMHRCTNAGSLVSDALRNLFGWDMNVRAA